MRVFLSHASEDEKTAAEIGLALRGAGHDVYFDADDLPPGGDYNTRIRDAIEASRAFVFLVSPHAVAAGKYTLTELKFAKQKWPKPWGRVLTVMVAHAPWKDVDPYLKAASVLTPAGNAAAGVADKFQPNVGWIAPMGGYTIDIRFVFSVAGKTVTVSTGPFKIDVRPEGCCLTAWRCPCRSRSTS